MHATTRSQPHLFRRACAHARAPVATSPAPLGDLRTASAQGQNAKPALDNFKAALLPVLLLEHPERSGNPSMRDMLGVIYGIWSEQAGVSACVYPSDGSSCLLNTNKTERDAACSARHESRDEEPKGHSAAHCCGMQNHHRKHASSSPRSTPGGACRQASTRPLRRPSTPSCGAPRCKTAPRGSTRT